MSASASKASAYGTSTTRPYRHPARPPRIGKCHLYYAACSICSQYFSRAVRHKIQSFSACRNGVNKER